MMQQKLRIGVLGTAHVTGPALIAPASRLPEVQVTVVASRNRSRAEKYALKHKIPRVAESYDALLADREVDAVYIPLPNSLHFEWTLEALRAGKHVLCEKPLASNAGEAQEMADVARQVGVVLSEAMHFRFHPMMARVREILDGGALGKISHIVAENCFPLLKRDFRYDYEFGGGSMMDLGCYAVSFMRFAAGREPQVVRADARLHSPKIDRWMLADFEFEDGSTGQIRSSMWSSDVLRGNAYITGENGKLTVRNPYVPQLYNELILQTGSTKKKEQLKGYQTTYYYQLKAFARAIQLGEPIDPGIDDAIANMRVIDAIYKKAGLPIRGAIAPASGVS